MEHILDEEITSIPIRCSVEDKSLIRQNVSIPKEKYILTLNFRIKILGKDRLLNIYLH